MSAAFVISPAQPQGFGTTCIHAGDQTDTRTGAVTAPISCVSNMVLFPPCSVRIRQLLYPSLLGTGWPPPLRKPHLASIWDLYLNKNNIGGMSAYTAFEIFVLECVVRVARATHYIDI
jgi:hypothetical protein